MRQTRAASRQIEALVDYYNAKLRYDATDNLTLATERAVARIEADPQGGFAAPRPYPSLARHRFRWIKEHRYWFGWSIAKGYPVLTNVFYDTASIEDRLAPDDDEDLPL